MLSRETYNAIDRTFQERAEWFDFATSEHDGTVMFRDLRIGDMFVINQTLCVKRSHRTFAGVDTKCVGPMGRAWDTLRGDVHVRPAY